MAAFNRIRLNEENATAPELILAIWLLAPGSSSMVVEGKAPSKRMLAGIRYARDFGVRITAPIGHMRLALRNQGIEVSAA